MKIAIAILLFPLSAFAEHPLTQRYLDGLFKAKPHLATFMGDHRFDGALPDLSPAALKAREADLVKLDADLAKTTSDALDDQIDASIMHDGIALELLYLREIKDWEWDPRLYDSFPYYDPREIVASRLSDIMHNDDLPLADRTLSVSKQLTALPAYLTQVRAAIDHGKRHVPKAYADQAVKDNEGRIDFFESELKAFTAKDDAAEAARKKATDALRDFQTYLKTTVEGTRADGKPFADGDFRLGDTLYRKKFPLALQTTRTPDEVVEHAQTELKRVHAALGDVAKQLHQDLWPGIMPPQNLGELIGKVKDELSKHHAKPDDLVASHARNLDALRAFIEKNDLLTLPPKESLRVEPMPAFKRGSSAAEYLAPGVLTPSKEWRATYYVDPIDPTWPKDKVESYLRGQNDYEVQLVAAHEAYPGHHTQNFYERKSLDRLRAVLWNAAFAEGWAVYGEGLMVKRGWGGRENARFQFYDLRGQMIVCANTILDVKLQTGQWSDKEAVDFMTKETFQEQAMADKKLLRAKLDSTQLVQYFLGLDEIRALEKEYALKVHSLDTQGQRAFDEVLIGHGSLAVQYLRRYALQGAK